MGFILSLAGLACDKTSFSTKPDLTFIEAGSYDVKQNDFLTFRIRVTDKEGDIADSLWIWPRTRKCPNAGIPFGYKFPQLPEKTNLDGEIDITYIINNSDGQYPNWNINLCAGVDTVNFQFWIKDKAGNRSDTVTTDKPVLIRNN